MVIKGDVKILLKHVLILYPGEDQQYANFTTELRKNPEFTTVLSLEMYEKAFLFYFQEYTPTSVFFFIVTLQSKDCARARQPSSHGFGGLKLFPSTSPTRMQNKNGNVNAAFDAEALAAAASAQCR